MNEVKQRDPMEQLGNLLLNSAEFSCSETDRADAAEAELAAISAAIGSTRFMDFPDGGSVSLAEQVLRMRKALEDAEVYAVEADQSLQFIEGAYQTRLKEAEAAFDEHDELLHQCLDERDRLRAAAKSA